MSERWKVNLLKYGICALVCGGMVYFYISVRDFAAQSLMERYRILADAFTVPGVVSIMVGLLLAISNEGFFTGLSYCMHVTVKALIPGGRLKIKKYKDYAEERRDKKITGYSFLFVVGGVLLAAAILFMILFYRLYN